MSHSEGRKVRRSLAASAGFLGCFRFQLGAYLVGARVAEVFEYDECLLPGLLRCLGLTCVFLSVPKLEEDIGFGAPVSDLPEDCLCLLVEVNGRGGASMVMAGFGEFLQGVGVLPSVAGLLEGGCCLLAQADGDLEGSEVFVDGAEPSQGHAFSPDIGGMAGGFQCLLQVILRFAEAFKEKVAESLQVPCRPLDVPVVGPSGYRKRALAALDSLLGLSDVQVCLSEGNQDPRFGGAVTEPPAYDEGGAEPGDEIPHASEQVEDNHERGGEFPGQDVITCRRSLADDWRQVREFALGPVPRLPVGREDWRPRRRRWQAEGQMLVVGVEDAPECIRCMQVPGKQAADGGRLARLRFAGLGAFGGVDADQVMELVPFPSGFLEQVPAGQDPQELPCLRDRRVD